MVERLMQKAREDAARKRRGVETIDPLIKVGRKMFPYLSERVLNDYATSALRIILSNRKIESHQMTLVIY
jgi:hypothetical protein